MNVVRFSELALGALLMSALGCQEPPRPAQVPAEYAGSTKLVVGNSYPSSFSICYVTLVRSSGGTSTNWLGTQKIAPNGQHEFAVAPGTYHFSTTSCPDDYSSGLSADMPVTIDGPTFIDIGTKGVAPPGMRVARIPLGASGGGAPVQPTAPANCVSPGGRTTNIDRCCGHLAEGTPPNLICQ